MGKKRAEKYEPKIILKDGVTFDDLLRVAVKRPIAPKKGKKSKK